jgi:hypothetical protein
MIRAPARRGAWRSTSERGTGARPRRALTARPPGLCPPHLAGQRLDAAVFAACGWPADLTCTAPNAVRCKCRGRRAAAVPGAGSDEQIPEKLLALNLEQAGAVFPP